MSILILPVALAVGIGIGWAVSWAQRRGKLFRPNGF